MKNDFLSTVSHELRTPLTVITGMGKTLEHQWETIDDEIRADFLTRLNANAATLEPLREAHADDIVEVEHRAAQARHVEELRLRFGVGRHRAVVVEMIVGQVGEERAIEAHAVYAALRKPVRRHFHRQRL